MKTRLVPLCGALAIVALSGISAMSQADMFSDRAMRKCLANAGGKAVMAPCNKSQHNNTMRYVAYENVFYGPLQQGGQCLDIQDNRVVWARCNKSKSQVWKFGIGQLHNDPGVCIVPSGDSVATRSCPATGTWLNLTYAVTVRVPNLSAAPGTHLAVRGNDVVEKNSGRVVAANAGPTVLAELQRNGVRMVAAGGGNIVAAGGGNMVAADGGNMVAAGTGN